MLVGSHCIIYSQDADADRKLLRDVLELPAVDVGEGWLIFGLPPSEVAVHPSDENEKHEFYLMVDDVARFVSDMHKHDVACDAIADHGYGLFTAMTLPGGGKLGVYQARHARPKAMPAAPAGKGAGRRTAAAAKKPTRKAGKKKAAKKKAAKKKAATKKAGRR